MGSIKIKNMVREIKFRVWDDKNKKWLLGYDLTNLGGFSMIGEVMLFGEYTRALSQFSIVDLDCVKVMQFTGEQDKFCKDIYEGDIIKGSSEMSSEESISSIEYNGHGFWVKDEAFGWEGELLWNWKDFEVIGNIYQNPELLK